MGLVTPRGVPKARKQGSGTVSDVTVQMVIGKKKRKKNASAQQHQPNRHGAKQSTSHSARRLA